MMRVTTEAANLKESLPRIERVTERGRRLRRPLEGKHALGPGVAGEFVSLFARLSRTLGRHSDRRTVKSVAGFGAHGRRMR